MSSESIKVTDDEARAVRLGRIMNDDSGRMAPASDRERPRVSQTELRRTEVRQKEAEKQAAGNRTTSIQHASSGSDQVAVPTSAPPPPPYPGIEEVRVSLAVICWLRLHVFILWSVVSHSPTMIGAVLWSLL